MKYIIILLTLLCMTSNAQDYNKLTESPQREYIVSGHFQAKYVSTDVNVIFTLPSNSAITGLFVRSVDTLWAYSANVVFKLGEPFNDELFVWAPEQMGLDDCLGCANVDWVPTEKMLFHKDPVEVILELGGPTEFQRGSFIIILKYIVLH